MTAREIVACVERLEKASEMALFWMAGGVTTLFPESRDDNAYKHSKAAAREARLLLRLTGEIRDEE